MFPLPFTHQINMYKEGRTDASFLPLESVVEGQVCSPGPHLASMNAAVCCRSLQEAQSCVKEAAMCPLPQWLALPLGHLPAGQEPQAGAPCQHCQLQTVMLPTSPKWGVENSGRKFFQEYNFNYADADFTGLLVGSFSILKYIICS